MLLPNARIRLELPEKIASSIFGPERYKIYYGGRGGAKSWSIARTLLAVGAGQKIRVLCTREIQKSIQESVHKLLADQIVEMNLAHLYRVQNTTILCEQTGTEFVFAGLRHNIANLKSYENVDICWVEEAQVVSETSWKVLIPTIRKPGSKIIVSFNPDLEDDPTYQRFVADPPPNAAIIKINYNDNQWLSDELKEEMEDCRRRSESDYRHIWLGECKQAIDGAIFAEELAKAAEEHRITRVPVKEGIPVNTFWDLGQRDYTAIWFCQLVGMEYRLIDFYQCNRQKMPHYIRKLADRGYLYGTHYLPHDAESDQLAAQSTIEQQLREALRDNPTLGKGVSIVPRIPKKALAIDAARNIFDQCLFDKELTGDGVQCLRRYCYATDMETGRVSKEPQDNTIWTHGADAFLQLAQHARPQRKKTKQQVNTKWIR